MAEAFWFMYGSTMWLIGALNREDAWWFNHSGSISSSWADPTSVDPYQKSVSHQSTDRLIDRSINQSIIVNHSGI